MAQEDLRRAKNEAIFREVNERVVGVRDGGEVDVLCECGTADCTESVRVALEDYERIRTDPTAFIVVPGHENPDVDRVEGEARSFLVVTKKGAAGDFAREHDPRAPDG